MKIWRKAFFVVIAFFSIGLSPVYAQYGEALGDNLLLSNTSPVDLAISIINWALGLLALVAVIIVLYGGFIWLTSGGNEEKLERAKKILRNGLIGLVIILSAWGITYYLINTLVDITNTEDDDDPYYPPNPFYEESLFYVTGTDPGNTEEGVSLCHIIQVFFNMELIGYSTEDTSNIEGNFCIYPALETRVRNCMEGNFAYSSNGRGFVFYPNEDYQESTTYHVSLGNGIEGLDEDLLVYNLRGGHNFTFATGTETDTIPPYVDFTYSDPYPNDSEEDVCLNTIIQATFSESIDSASVNDENILLSQGETSVLVDSIGLTTVGSGEDVNYNTVYGYPSTALTEFTEYNLSLYSGDALNDFDGAIMDTCGNPLDGNYNVVAEGSDADDFIEPNSTTDDSITDQQDEETGTWLYPWTFTTGENDDCTPIITSIDPTSGYYSEDNGDDTYSDQVEISGYYLMNAYDVKFYNSVSAGDTALGCFDTDHQVAQGCINSKSNESIIVRTPVGSQTGRISAVSESGTGSSDSTYIVNSPYISRISPSAGPIGQPITLSGSNFGETQGTVYFRDFDGTNLIAAFPCADSWDNDRIIITVPEGVDDLENPKIQITTSDSYYSNYLDFTYEDGIPGPALCTIEPSCSETGAEAITLGTAGLSSGEGLSYFYSYALEDSEQATISSWDSGIESVTLEEVPFDYQNTIGEYNVVVQNSDLSESNGLNFEMPCTDAPSVVQARSCSPDDDAFPLPNPYLNEDEACRNSAVIVGFDQAMDDTTFNSGNIAIYKCNDGYDDGEDLDYDSLECGSENLLVDRFIDEDYITSGDYDGFKIQKFRFEAEHWYQINLSTSVLAETGVGLSSDYSWHFRIRDLDEHCEADYLNLSQSYRDFNTFDQLSFDNPSDRTSWQDFNASPYTVECIALNEQDTSWTLIDSIDPGDEFPQTTQTVVSFYNDLTLSASEITEESGDNNIYMMGSRDDVNEGDVYLRAVVDGGAYDNAPVSVDFGYCETTAVCAAACPGSVCDLEAHKCTPVIDDVSPDDGGEGSCVTISGCFFGNEPGETGNVNLSDSDFTYPTNANCDTWEDDQIVAKVPGIALGGYTLNLTSAYGLTVSYDTFTVNTEERPCLCSIDPDQGSEGRATTLYGEDFGTNTGTVSFYNTIAAEIIDPWDDEEINTSVPQGASTGEVYMTNSDGTDSNPLDFSVTCSRDSDCGTGCCSDGVCSAASVCNECLVRTDCTDEYAGCYGDCVEGTCEPYIASISPDLGDTGQPVTLSGCYFGDSGTVSFDEDEAGLLCGSSWSNIEIITKTPDNTNWGVDELANISLINNSPLTSNSVEFDLDNSCTGYAYPILCELFDDDTNNTYGPYGASLYFDGENFAALDEQYCLCSNDDPSETCSIPEGATRIICSGDSTCSIEAECTENRDSYGTATDDTTDTCPCYNSAEEEVCSVAEGESSCDYAYDCSLDSTCATDSDTYQAVGGYIDYPGSGLFSDADYTTAYQSSIELNGFVPAYDSGATSGDVYVGTQDTDSGQSCNSNGLNFDITCSSCDDTPDGQHCDLSYGESAYGRVTSGTSGFCQEDSDSCCGSTGCVVDDVSLGYCTCTSGSESCTVDANQEQDSCPTDSGVICSLSETCSSNNENIDTYETGVCTERPSVVSVTPSDASADVCLNAAVSVTFSEYMTLSEGNIGVNEYINLKVGGISGADADTTITTTDDTTFVITMSDGTALSANTTYYIEVISNSSDESGMISTESGLSVDQTVPSYTSFTTANTADACPIDVVEVEASSLSFEDNGYVLSYEGESQSLNAVAYDSDGQELRSIEDYYSWVWSWSPEFSDCDIAGIDSSDDDYDNSNDYQDVIAGAVEGSSTITATATASYGWGPGSVNGGEDIYVDFCPAGYLWDYDNETYNIRMSYCRSEDGDADTALPELSGPAIIEIGSDAMAEFLFTFTEESGNEDAIGLRIYANNTETTNTTHIDAVSPELWYQVFFESVDSVSTTTVDGYPAAQVGRSTYVAATNESSGDLYPNIYLLSYSQDASEETQSVINEILSNLKLSTNVDSDCGSDDSDKQKLIRDTERLTEIGTMGYYLNEYKDSNGDYPDLNTGSYIQGMSTSKWPSWQATLANDLGSASPEDPYNTFDDDSCSSDFFEAETCWDDTNKLFSGSGYYYMYQGDGSTYNLYANLEYTDGNWDTTVSDPCTGSSTCDSFNYQLNSSTYEDL